jgi:hypothetical protein
MPNAISISDQARALTQTVGVRVRDDLCVVVVRGDDARIWLNGQVTNDLRPLVQGSSIYALAITVRGKIMADLWVLDRGAQLVLLLPEEARHAVLESFERQIIMEDVELVPEPLSRVISIQGPLAHKVVEQVEPSLRDAHSADELGQGGVFVLVPESELPDLLAQIVERAHALGGAAVDDAGFELARVRSGRARFGRDFSDQQYPQEAGLKERAVSFNKGCYLGQEVVCTLESRGRLSRALTQLIGDGDETPACDAEVFDAKGQAIGRLTSVVRDPDGNRVRALGYLKSAHTAPGTLLHAGTGDLVVVGSCGA